jgi:hypothetical protein
MDSRQPNQQLTPEELQNSLQQFTGSEECYRHWSKRFIYTEGVKFLAENTNSYWLLDAIASYQPHIKNQRLKEFQIWQLEKHSDNSATLTCIEDSDIPPAIKQEIEYTDFPLQKVKIYLTNQVLILPSEY